MNPMPELSPYLKQLRLSGILDSLEARNRQAIDSKLAYTGFLALLIQDVSTVTQISPSTVIENSPPLTRPQLIAWAASSLRINPAFSFSLSR